MIKVITDENQVFDQLADLVIDSFLALRDIGCGTAPVNKLRSGGINTFGTATNLWTP